MDKLLLLILYYVCRAYITAFFNLTRLAASFGTAAVAKLDPQNGAAPSSHVVLITCVKYLYKDICFSVTCSLHTIECNKYFEIGLNRYNF